MENFYVKNTNDKTKIYLKLKPILFPDSEFTYEGTEIIAEEGKWETGTYALTYQDLLKMYEAGFHTIEKEEFERAEALMKISTNQELET